MKDEKILGADAAAVVTAEPVASDQLSHAAWTKVYRGRYCDFCGTAERQCGVMFLSPVKRDDAPIICGACIDYFVRIMVREGHVKIGTGNQATNGTSGSVPSEALKDSND